MKFKLKAALAVVLAAIMVLAALPVSALPRVEEETNVCSDEKSTPEWKTWAQSDPRWGNLTLGWGTGATVARWGCLATSVTKLAIQSGCKNPYSWNVYNFVTDMNNYGGFTSSGGMYWAAPPNVIGNGFYYVGQKGYGGSSWDVQSRIIEWARNGEQMVLKVNNGGHWIAVDNELTIANNRVWIMDSGNVNTNSRPLTDAYSYVNDVYSYRGQVSYIDAYANLGDVFYGVILNYECWKPIGVNPDDNKIYLQNEVGSAMQKWRFERQSDGAYVITSCYNGNAIEMTDGILQGGTQLTARQFWGGYYQQWYLIRYGNGYIFKSKHFPDQNWCMDLFEGLPNDGNRIIIYPRNNSTAQIWSIYRGDEIQLHGTTISASVDGNNVTVTWPRIYGADHYSLKIWKDTLWQGESYYTEWYAQSGITVTLPAGLYHIYVDTADYYQYFMSNVITLEITYSPPLQGDVDSNGNVNTTDALLALRMGMGMLPVTNLEAADMNGDGIVSVIDALMIMRISLGTA